MKWLMESPAGRAAVRALVAMGLGVALAIPVVAELLPPGVARCLAEPGVLSVLKSSSASPTQLRVPTSLASD